MSFVIGAVFGAFLMALYVKAREYQINKKITGKK